MATIPTAGGVEDVVMRILAAGEPIPLDKLGVLPHNMERLKSCITKPYGLFFVCGPTGSGKTTTLHSVLKLAQHARHQDLDRRGPGRNHAEGPAPVPGEPEGGPQLRHGDEGVPARRPGHHHGRRDARQGHHRRIGIEASLTGHLVFATLHTNSAPESIIRLLDMGMDPFNFADALLGILAQRLAKRLCKCKEAYTPDQAEIKHFLTEYCERAGEHRRSSRRTRRRGYKKVFERFQKDYGFGKPDFKFYKPKGCDNCGGTRLQGPRAACTSCWSAPTR